MRLNKLIQLLILIHNYVIILTYNLFTYIVKNIPEYVIPTFKINFKKNNSIIIIDNVQYATNDNVFLKDITNKSIIILYYLWDDTICGFILSDFLKFLETCSMLYINYRVITTNSNMNKHIIKIIDTSNIKNPRYSNMINHSIPFGEIKF